MARLILTSAHAPRGYRHAIEEFVEWCCWEPRLSFSRTVVLRYRIHLESRNLAPGTINLRLGPVRRLAYEAADCGLLSPDLAAGIRRVKGVKDWRKARKLAHRTVAETVAGSRHQHLKEKRDRALLAVLLACGLPRREAVEPQSRRGLCPFRIDSERRWSEVVFRFRKVQFQCA